MGLQDSVYRSAQSLEIYQKEKKLPKELFLYPDSVTYMPESMDEFSDLMRQSSRRDTSFFEKSGRYAAITKLSGAVGLGNFGQIRWVEYVEPSEEDMELGWTGVQHLNFFFRGLETATQILKVRGVDHAIEQGRRQELFAIYDRAGNEFRLVDTAAEESISQH